MKHIWSTVIICVLALSLVGCTQPQTGQPPQTTTQTIPEESELPSSEQETFAPEEGYAFVTEEQKQLWKDDLLACLALINIHDPDNDSFGAFSAGLMDMNCDGTPELLAAYYGGSMGNVFVEIWDLKTKEMVESHDFGYYQDSGSINLCVAEHDGEYVVISQGTLRDHDIGWLDLVGVIDENYGHDYIFGHTNGEDAVHYYRGELTDKAEYNAQYKQFFEEYTVLRSTQVRLLRWNMEGGWNPTRIKQSMADALLTSSQTFIDFDR